jgi:hypothetical protein
MYSNVDITILKNKDATLQTVRKALDAIAEKAGPDDMVIFHMGGHGFPLSFMEPYTDKQERAGLGAFLYCFGNLDVKNMKNTTMGFNEIAERFVKIPSRKILLIDACHSGLARVGLDTEANPIRVLTRDGVGPAILCACTQAQEAIEESTGGTDSGKARGLFTIALRRILEEDEAFDKTDVNRDGVVDARELANGVRTQVGLLIRQLRDEGLLKESDKGQDPVEFVPRLMERVPVVRKQ